ncbi:MAG: AbrB/MazE/SpoVT family DNA-binding domain-containing protein [Clostridia bacterium]|nr:AbrB/MazE/SpoVT family DNA-binding domain-containing protein [Clostridia bacterium]
MPSGKHIFGTVKVGDKGQIVIPKEAREIFGIKPGDTLLVLGNDDKGIIVTRPEVINDIAMRILDSESEEEMDDNE